MDVLRAVCLVLTCVLAHAESSNEDPCLALGDCVAPLDTYLLDFETLTPNFALFNESSIDTFCQLTQVASKCIEDRKPACPTGFYFDNVNFYEARARYICTEEGRAETLAVAKSECVGDKETGNEVRKEINDCISKVNEEQDNSEEDESCEFGEQREQCIIDAAMKKCGEDYVMYKKRVETEDYNEFRGCA